MYKLNIKEMWYYPLDELLFLFHEINLASCSSGITELTVYYSMALIYQSMTSCSEYITKIIYVSFLILTVNHDESPAYALGALFAYNTVCVVGPLCIWIMRRQFLRMIDLKLAANTSLWTGVAGLTTRWYHTNRCSILSNLCFVSESSHYNADQFTHHCGVQLCRHRCAD